MSSPTKPAWPKKTDGTTDWEIVFEDEAAGLIPAVMKADSAMALGKGAYTLIQSLFTRKSDEANAAELLARLEMIIVDSSKAADLETKKQHVAKLLRDIKEERQRKAAEHLRRKERGNAIERRGRSERLKKRLMIAGVGGVLMFLAAGLGAVMAAFILDDSPVRTVTAEFTPSTQAPSRSVDGGDAVSEADAPDASTAEAPPPVQRYVLLNLVSWAFAPDGNKARTIHYSPLIELADMDDVTHVCRHLPSLLDIINQTISTVFRRHAQPDETELMNANTYATEALNKKLGAGTVVGFHLTREVQGRARVNTRQPCRIYPPLETE